MSKGKFKENVEWLSDPKIAITVAVLVLIAIGVVWYFWDKIKDAFSGKKKEIENKNKFGEANELTDFDSLAQQLYNATRPYVFGWGTDVDAVTRVLSQIYSNGDYAALRTAYQRFDTKYTLDARLQDEGRDKDLAVWRTTLKNNGVTIYSF